MNTHPDAPVEIELLTLSEAAKRLRIGRTHAYRLAARHDIPTVRLGRALRVPARALAQWIEEHTQREGERDD